MSLNRDTIVAIVLLVICGGLAFASLDIREPDYGQLSPATWPRVVIAATTVLVLIYLAQSVMAGPDAPDPEAPRGIGGWLAHWRNVIWCFALFGVYLLAIPRVGILLGGMAFVFLLLTALGGVRRTPLHAVVAVVAIGGIWLIFTHGLHVFLPRGEWTGF